MKIKFKMIFKIIAYLLLVIAFEAHSQTISEEKSFDVYLLIGQSNMSGRGVLDPKNNTIQENILMLDKDNNWVIAKDPLHFDKSIAGVGPGISFAKSMLKGHKKSKIGLIPCAWGGSPIKVWKSGAEYLDHFPYDEAIARVKIAIQKGGILKSILWHQGESDNDTEKAKIYLDKLKELIADLRRDLNAPNLPFVAGEIGRFNKKDIINEIINKLPAEVANTAVVSSKNLKDRGDHVHFNTLSAQKLGKRYAKAMKKLQK